MKMIHIHQGGTLLTYCGINTSHPILTVSWESASKSTCPGCRAHFEVELRGAGR